MTAIEDQPTDMIVFSPRDLCDDDEPTLPPGPRSESTLEELHREMETATGDWLRTLIGAVGEATKRGGRR